MIAQYRPDIARALEQTVVNLKGLEQTLEILRTDLATLAHSIGHPQAAQFVLTPTRGLGIVAAGGLNAVNPNLMGWYGPQVGAFGPIGAQTPYGSGFQTPYAGGPPQVGIGAIGTPHATPGIGFPNVGTPFVGQPPVTNPYASLYR